VVVIFELPAQPRIFPGAVASKVESALRFASGVARDRPAIPMPALGRIGDGHKASERRP
jgi:hypothetical protein